MRRGSAAVFAAIMLAGVGIAGGVYLGSARLSQSRHFNCVASPDFGGGTCDSTVSSWSVVSTKGAWQIPVAIVAAFAGVAAGAALLVARRPQGQLGGDLLSS